jgi:hypothetical protein
MVGRFLMRRSIRRRSGSVCVLLVMLAWSVPLAARQNIRSAFFDVYPGAVGTAIETLPSNSNHCGVCHFDFEGGGARNPYGLQLEAELPNHASNPNGRRQAVMAIAALDADGDGFSNATEASDIANYANTPTFPGLTPSNVNGVLNVDLADVQSYLVPSVGVDTTPPAVTVLTPNGAEVVTGNTAVTVQWTAADSNGVAAVNLLLSEDGGANFRLLVAGLANTGQHDLFVPNRPTASGIVRVEAIDNAFNVGYDDSDAVFTVAAPTHGIAPTTLRDFDMPGSQPFDAGTLNDPAACAVCHGNYDQNVEPYFNWQGSMMAHASRDPLFEACLAIANQDAPDSGDLCLRCHIPRGWLRGRSVPTDGSRMLAVDGSGVSCDLCHRLVDPIYEPGVSPPEDQAILAALAAVPDTFGNGMYVVDPTGARRGPFVDAVSGHPILVSPFHREAALCGTCHDVGNPAFEKDLSTNGVYLPNAFDASAPNLASSHILPIERTYSEWFHSAYNTVQGVYAPEFGGNRDYVATCQDCHLRDVTGQGCNLGPPVRSDLPLHDMTGGSTWLPGLLATIYPDDVNASAVQAGVARARYMLQQAADLELEQVGRQLEVTVTNNTGHKLPTGYPEGRRMWLHVRFLDTNGVLLGESGAYDPQTGVLTADADLQVYETKPGLDAVTAPLVGVAPGPSFHFVLNDFIFKDNRIPPRGFTNAAYTAFGGAPVGTTYADGQYWDTTHYAIPPGTRSVAVTLNYQSTSKAYVEFLRDENTTNTRGQELYDLWNNNGKCPPEIMATQQAAIMDAVPGDGDGDGDVDLADLIQFVACLGGPAMSVSPTCAVFDTHADNRVDLREFAVMQRQFDP